MSAAGSTDAVTPPLSPVMRDAAEGRLPDWAVAKPSRREHIARVAALVRSWAEALALPPVDVARWTAAATLHDALRDATPDALLPLVPPAFAHLPSKLLHGPAAAARLAGQADDEVLDAIRYHTLGSPRFGALGRAVYLADFLEPGRTFAPAWTASLRARMPHEREAVLREVVERRVGHVLAHGATLHPETVAFHGAVCEGR